MELSARDKLSGTIEHQVRCRDGRDHRECRRGLVTAAITDSSREQMGLAEGDEVAVVFKSTEVMIGKG